MGTRRRLRAVLALAALAPLAAGRATAFADVFPSPDSTVVAPVGGGFLDEDEVGYFYSASSSHGVAESFDAGLPQITRAVLDLFVHANTANVPVSWGLRVNGVPVGSFGLAVGQTGPVHVDLSFAPIAGPSYQVRLEIQTNVSSGSQTLAYAGSQVGALELLPPVESFTCRQAKDLRAPKFVPVADLAVQDALAGELVDVKKPALVCAPTSVEGGPVSDPATSLCCYAIKGTALNPAVPVTADDPFGALSLGLSKPKLLCRPCRVALP